MPFTDDNLKQLKEFVEAHGFWTPEMDREKLTIRRNFMSALLARLEAAEIICSALQARGSWYVYGSSPFALEAWRKAAGK